MRIVITNIVVLNGGDGAILFGMLKTLRRTFGENCEIHVFASEPVVAKRMYPEVDFGETLGIAATRAPAVRCVGRIIRTLRTAQHLVAAAAFGRGYQCLTKLLVDRDRFRDLAVYAGADLVVSSGGTYLKEEYGLLSQICDYRITLLLRRPLAFFTQSLGPFTRPQSRAAMQEVFNAATAALLRDEQSLKNLVGIGVCPDRLSLSSDAAFALGDPDVLTRAKHRALPTDRPLRVAISVRRWPHFRSVTNEVGMAQYKQVIAALTEWLIKERKAEVTFLSTCQGIPEYDDDSRTAEEVIALLPREVTGRVRLTGEFVRFDELLRRLPEYDFVVATRMHMCILSLLSGTPVLPIAYEFKTAELFGRLGLGEWVLDLESLAVKPCLTHAERFLEALAGFRERLFTLVENERQRALDSGSLLRRTLHGCGA